jgi:hypothetical protein
MLDNSPKRESRIGSKKLADANETFTPETTRKEVRFDQWQRV